MFGGWVWLLWGARDDGMLVRLGKGNDGWALDIPGVEPMISRGKHMSGWVRALRGPERKAVASEGRVVPGSRSAGRFFD